MSKREQPKGGVKGGHAVAVPMHSSYSPNHRPHLPQHLPQLNHDAVVPEQWPKGLTNVGNTCYANATLQCLLSTALTNALLDPKVLPLFRRYSSNPNLLAQGSGSVDSEDPIDANTPKIKSDPAPVCSTAAARKKEEEARMQDTCRWLTRELTSITHEYTNNAIRVQPSAQPSYLNWLGSTPATPLNVVNPGSITRHPDRLSKCLHPYQQEDAHEFMRALLGTLVMNGHNRQLSSLFDGLLESAVTCKTCGRASLTRDRYMDLSLDINDPDIKTLDDALFHYTKAETLEGDNAVHCARCNKKRTVTKGLRLATAPSILVCHLKRFAFDHYGRLIRLHKKIQFPPTLEIEDFMSNLNKARPPPYDLVAVLVHQGQTCASGHYLAFVKKDNEWFKCNDSEVTPVDEATVFSQQAYIMMYEVAEMREKTGCTPKPENSIVLPEQFEDEAEMSKAVASNGSCASEHSSQASSARGAPYQRLLQFIHNTDSITRFLADMCCDGSNFTKEAPTEVKQSRRRRKHKKSPGRKLRRTFSGENIKILEVKRSKGVRSQTAPRQRTHSYDYIEPGYNMDSPRTTYSAHTDEPNRPRRSQPRSRQTPKLSERKGQRPGELPPLPRSRAKSSRKKEDFLV
eukprot:Nitzschia sp. Nitz4//scaffold257_size48314//27040//28923//NITZ4_007092-RA/size48314-processed-gene-0.34-mRNA-1//1//CDS//3329544457//6699//frame0